MSSKDIYSGPRVTNLETFIQKAQFVHGDKFGYDKAEYVNAKSKITITCPIHRDFQQTPSDHLNGYGCRDCYFDSNRSNTDEFIEKSKLVHGDKYSYEKTEYTGSKSKLTITCPIHGDFEQKPNAHLSGHGCASCRYDSDRSNTEEFIQKTKEIHDNKYSYEKTEYSGALTKVIITCPIHGDFQQLPNSHLNGRGCPSCAYESNPGGYTNNKEEYKEQPAILYHVRFTVKETDEAFEKIGITVKSVKDRFSQISKNHELKLEVINEYPTTLYEAIEIEKQVKSYLVENDLAYRVHTLKQYNLGGWSECFRCGDLDTLLMSTSCLSFS